jgi:hypothetical protein
MSDHPSHLHSDLTRGLLQRLLENYEDWQIEKIGVSWFLQDKEARRHRLKTVIALSIELEKIRQVSIFSCGIGEQVIEAVIEGDWRGVELTTEMLTFEGEGPEIIDKYAPLWANFRTIAQTAIAEFNRKAAEGDIEAN